MKIQILIFLMALATSGAAGADEPKLPPVPSKRLPEAVPAARASAPLPAAADVPAPKPSRPEATPSPTQAPAPPELELLFLYGSEKRRWIDDVTKTFNDSARTLPSGEHIRVRPVAAGSGELITDALEGRQKPHLVSPAASAFILRGNAESNERGDGELVGDTVDLVSSPVVVAMWREMAEAIGWPGRSLKWSDVFEYARDPEAWRKVAKPEWGAFRLGHTQPETSNSGLHALFAEAFAAVDRFEGFSRADAADARVAKSLKEVEAAVPYYETSTGFLAERMVREGRGALSAAIVYENLVIEANQEAKRREPAVDLPQVVAIYPAEGTFPSEHPVGVVRRPWVTEKHRQAAEIYIAFLRDTPQQDLAMRSGFRPAVVSNEGLKAMLRPELGVDEKQPVRTLKPPPASAIRVLLDTWAKEKNPNAAPASGR